MDYQEKYEQALERAKKLYEQGTITESLGYVFPELKKKESKDEKIMRELYKAIWTYIPYEKAQEYIAWLEKQGKEEYALKSFRDKDVHKFMQYIEKQAKAYEFNLPNRGYDIYAFAKDILTWLEKQTNKD